jgi:cystathionine beta-synthase
MRENGFYEVPAQPTLADVLAFRHNFSADVPLVVGVSPNDSIAEAISRFHRYGISQLPILDAGQLTGSLTENSLLQRFAAGERLHDQRVRDWAEPPLPALPESAPVREAYTLLAGGQMAIAVISEDRLAGVISKSDLMEFWAESSGVGGNNS